MKACLQNLDSDIEHLTRTVEGAGERQTFRDSMAASIMPTRLDLPPRLPVFSPSLARISGYAQRLHDALQSVQACPLRRSHRVNLRLESRLKSRSSNSVDDGYGTAHFTFVCESCHKDSCSWQSLEVLVSASQDADNSEHDPSSRGVRFAHEGEGTPAGPYVRGECISDLCLSMANSRPTMGEKARFYLDAGNQMVRWGNSTIPLAGEKSRRFFIKHIMHLSGISSEVSSSRLCHDDCTTSLHDVTIEDASPCAKKSFILLLHLAIVCQRTLPGNNSPDKLPMRLSSSRQASLTCGASMITPQPGNINIRTCRRIPCASPPGPSSV
jgi:hypothetical protein